MTFPPILSLLLSLLFLYPPSPATAIDDVTSALYLPKPTFLIDYHNMLTNFKIFIYPPPPTHNDVVGVPFNLTTPPLSLFHTSLITRSHFLTPDPNQAHLFFLPFPPQSTRSLARFMHRIRTSYLFWDRSLGADHFYLSSQRVGPTSSRAVVELKKNAVQISCFPSLTGEFIPHKDISLPPPTTLITLDQNKTTLTRRLGYSRFSKVRSGSSLIGGLGKDPQFLIESEPSDESVYIERLTTSKFCLFAYIEAVGGLIEALGHGCVPVVITDRPINDLPLMDVIKWSEIALFVGSGVGHEELKRVLVRTCEVSGRYEKMRRLGVAAAHHFKWNESPEPFDAFHMVMYQLWVRRHAIRYDRWDKVQVA